MCAVATGSVASPDCHPTAPQRAHAAALVKAARPTRCRFSLRATAASPGRATEAQSVKQPMRGPGQGTIDVAQPWVRRGPAPGNCSGSRRSTKGGTQANDPEHRVSHFAPTLLLVVGCLSILLFLSAPLFAGPAGPFAGRRRWATLMDGIGFIFWSRSFVSEPTVGTLFAIGSVFLLTGVYLTWKPARPSAPHGSAVVNE